MLCVYVRGDSNGDWHSEYQGELLAGQQGYTDMQHHENCAGTDQAVDSFGLRVLTFPHHKTLTTGLRHVPRVTLYMYNKCRTQVSVQLVELITKLQVIMQKDNVDYKSCFFLFSESNHKKPKLHSHFVECVIKRQWNSWAVTL